MIVCLCNAVDDKTVRKVISGGAATVDAVARACSAGDCCGGCREFIGEMIDAEDRRRSLPLLAPVLVPA